MDDKPLLNDHDNNGNKVNDTNVINILKDTKLSAGNNTALSKRENFRERTQFYSEYDYPDDR